MTSTPRRWTAFVVPLLLIAAVAGCSSTTPAVPSGEAQVVPAAADETLQTVVVDGVRRSFIVRAPDDLGDDEKLPVLVLFHGAGSNASRAERATGLTDIAAANRFIAVYPNGTAVDSVAGELGWNAGVCCGLAVSNKVDDVAFVSAMIDALETDFAVDPDRVYLAGFSNGGMMTYRLACELGNRITAIAVVSGALNVACAAPKPLPVLIIHGTGDLTVPYDGGLTNPGTAARFGQWTNASVAQSSAYWATRNECLGGPRSLVNAFFPSAKSTAVSYSGCTDGSALEVVTIAGGKHVWPRTPVAGFYGSALIADFFDLN